MLSGPVLDNEIMALVTMFATYLRHRVPTTVGKGDFLTGGGGGGATGAAAGGGGGGEGKTRSKSPPNMPPTTKLKTPTHRSAGVR